MGCSPYSRAHLLHNALDGKEDASDLHSAETRLTVSTKSASISAGHPVQARAKEHAMRSHNLAPTTQGAHREDGEHSHNEIIQRERRQPLP